MRCCTPLHAKNCFHLKEVMWSWIVQLFPKTHDGENLLLLLNSFGSWKMQWGWSERMKLIKNAGEHQQTRFSMQALSRFAPVCLTSFSVYCRPLQQRDVKACGSIQWSPRGIERMHCSYVSLGFLSIFPFKPPQRSLLRNNIFIDSLLILFLLFHFLK